jgi:intracellular sulfur oxidation DsrE/DsrF family protein
MNSKLSVLKAVSLLLALLWSANTLAAQGIIPQCKYLPLANNPIITGVPNTTICVDIPVSLTKNHVVFSIDSLATTTGTDEGAPVALRHMWMLGSAMLEVCGVTLAGKGLTSNDVYSSPNGRIYVNQGALGRIIDLEQQGYAYLQEGWVDADKYHHHWDHDND